MATKSTRNINSKPAVVSRPTGRTGGTNPSVSAVKSPTKYTGGKMAPPKNAVPAGKGATKSKMSKKK